MNDTEKEKAKLNKIKQVQQAGAISLFTEAIKEKKIEDFSLEIVNSTKAANTILVNVNGNNVLLKVSANPQKWFSDVPKIVDALSDKTKSSLEIFDALMDTKIPPIEIPLRLSNDVTLKPNKDGKVRLFAQGILRNIYFQTVKELELVGMTEIEKNALCPFWRDGVPAKTVHCTDGDAEI